MWSVLSYLNESVLVADIQRKLGVKDRQLDVKNSKGHRTASNVVDDEKTTEKVQDFVIENKFWYYLFSIGTSLGDEIFYASFIPFWFWNIDGAVGRRMVCVWCVVMYIGQLIKDIVRWPRPTHPAKRLQKKWAEEYGMPSTHAMVSVSIPFSIIHFTKNRYIYQVSLGVIASTIWCAVISVSRLYFGMHTVLDVLVGLFLALLLTVAIIPSVDQLDYFWISNSWSPVILIAVAILLILLFPRSERWTPTRGDTAMIVSVCAGIHVGAWTNYQLGNIIPLNEPPPYPVIWPNYYMAGLGALRTVLGFSLILLTRNTSKYVVKSFFCWLLKVDKEVLMKGSDNTQTKLQSFIELCSKFITYFSIGFNILYSIPIFFRFLGIERPTFYTEI